MSMFVSSKWQHVTLPTGWRASVCALFYCYLTFLDHRTNISRKVGTPGAPNKFQNCHLDKANMDKTSQHHSCITPPQGSGLKMVRKKIPTWAECTKSSVGISWPIERRELDKEPPLQPFMYWRWSIIRVTGRNGSLISIRAYVHTYMSFTS